MTALPFKFFEGQSGEVTGVLLRKVCVITKCSNNSFFKNGQRLTIKDDVIDCNRDDWR